MIAVWNALDMRRRTVVVVATVAMFAAVLGLSRMAATPDMSLLYSGLDSANAGEVVAALEARGVAYKVQGGAIHVAAAQRDELRMTLAAEGLPSAGSAGYELLDELSGFGTTAQMFDAAYWRAKEGELARTLLAIPQVRAARVHIARSDPQPFRSTEPPTASITITSSTGTLSAEQARAMKHLVSAAVAGMSPENVSVIDSSSGLVLSGEEAPLPAMAGDARAAELKQNVERLLAARVGPGKAVVEVTVEVVNEHEQISERRLDPDGRVAISTDTEEKSGTSTQDNGPVTVASNLPEDEAAEGGGDRSQSNETRERVNFEVSETTRDIVRAPGSIRKLSVAVLVDSVQVPAADGTFTAQDRPPEELEVLRELVASAVGFDEARGDVITLRSLAFEPVPQLGTLAEAGIAAGLLGGLDMMSIVQMALLALVALVLGLFVVRPLLSSGKTAAELPAPPMPMPLQLPLSGDELPQMGYPRIVTGEIDDSDLPPLSVLSGETGDAPLDPVARLRLLIEERQAESIEILRGWMEDREEKA